MRQCCHVAMLPCHMHIYEKIVIFVCFLFSKDFFDFYQYFSFSFYEIIMFSLKQEPRARNCTQNMYIDITYILFCQQHLIYPLCVVPIRYSEPQFPPFILKVPSSRSPHYYTSIQYFFSLLFFFCLPYIILNIALARTEAITILCAQKSSRFA